MIRYHLLFSPLLLFLLAFNACSFSMSSANNNADGDVDIDQVGFEEEVDGEEDKADNVDVVEEELELEPPNSPACKDWMTDERYLNEEACAVMRLCAARKYAVLASANGNMNMIYWIFPIIYLNPTTGLTFVWAYPLQVNTNCTTTCSIILIEPLIPKQ